jgi:hypothetical protein
MALHTTRRSLLCTAASLPALALFGQESDAWEARRRSYLQTASRVTAQPLWALHAELLRRRSEVPRVAAAFSALDTVYRAIAKLAIGDPIDPSGFNLVLEYLATRQDLVDFIMSAVIRLLYLYGNDPRIPADLKQRLEEAVLDFRPWLYPEDSPVKTVAYYWTENHEALYSSIEYLAGQRYPNKLFRWTGKPGSWHMEHGRKNLLVWLGLRARYGMSEWLAPGYYSEDMIALMNVADFARDPVMANAAKGLTEILLLDLALHTFDGGLRASSGRTYLRMLKDARTADTGAVVSLAFGIDSPVRQPLAGSAIALATSPSYRVPEAIVRIAHARPPEVVVHEKSGFSPEEALALGFRPDDLNDIMTFWTIEAYRYPGIFRSSAAAFRRWKVGRSTPDSEGAQQEELPRAGGDSARMPDNTPTALFGADIETYRTPDYQVSTAQDYRKGKPGYQQQIFLASLGGTASVWTSHPGADTEQGRPSSWVGNGYMPRAAQFKNLVLVLYRIPPEDPRPFSHVYFPASEFDEVREQAGWAFGRKGNGYIAITARPEMILTTRAQYAGFERISNARESAWICRLGRKAQDGSFGEFVERLAKASIESSANRISYAEPSGLKATFGWDDDLVVNGQRIPLHGYPRYDTPFIKTARGTQLYRIAYDNLTHTIDLSGLKVGPFREMT